MFATSDVARAESRAVEPLHLIEADGAESEHVDAASIAAAKLAKRDAAAKRAMNAASDVALGAKHGAPDERLLDARIVFGDLLANAANKFIAFSVGDANVHIPRAKLAETARVLRRRITRGELAVSVDKSALRIRWNDGRGGLNFTGRVVTRAEREVTLDVVFPAVQPSAAPVAAPAIAPRAKTADEQAACASPSSCELATPARCVRAASRWQAFQSYREIVDLLRPALAAAQPGDALAVDADVFARVQALFGGAASRDQLGGPTAPAVGSACV